MAILSRVADRLYWGARYIERAEDSARIIKAHHELMNDGGEAAGLSWAHLAAIAGTGAVTAGTGADTAGSGAEGTGAGTSPEQQVLHRLMVDPDQSGSIVSSIRFSRENLRTTREVMPREAWQAVNGLSMFTDVAAATAVERHRRDGFLTRVIDDSRRLDGVVDSTMTRSNAYRMWRLGRLVERADMTTRVLGVRAAALLSAQADRTAATQGGGQSQGAHGVMRGSGGVTVAESVEWMAVLRSVSALQMYQRAVRGPIEAEAVVRFLLFYAAFPRSVASCLDEIRAVLTALPSARDPLAALDEAQSELAGCDPVVTDGRDLDRAIDRCQLAIAALDRAIHARYVGP